MLLMPMHERRNRKRNEGKIYCRIRSMMQLIACYVIFDYEFSSSPARKKSAVGSKFNIIIKELPYRKIIIVSLELFMSFNIRFSSFSTNF
jgi:hypothetical protein